MFYFVGFFTVRIELDSNRYAYCSVVKSEAFLL
jgi:hypothetical protein